MESVGDWNFPTSMTEQKLIKLMMEAGILTRVDQKEISITLSLVKVAIDKI
jgi:hypothetical protein